MKNYIVPLTKQEERLTRLIEGAPHVHQAKSSSFSAAGMSDTNQMPSVQFAFT